MQKKNPNLFLNIFVFLLFVYTQNKAQTLKFLNPSFEGYNWEVISANEWSDCGFEGESPPDIQPGAFSVTKAAKHGNSYLGMVVRDNKTWEMVSQKLMDGVLEKDNCYDFSVDLCRSLIYESTSRVNYMPASFTEPAILRIWAGNYACEKKELLFQTPVITFTEWKTFNIRLQPKSGNYSYLVFEAYYKSNTYYNGNVLMDNITNINKVNCKEEFKKDTSTTLIADIKKEKIVTTPPKVHNIETVIKNADVIKKGDIIKLNKLMFDADKAVIKPESETVLNNVYQILLENPQITVEIGGHTNNYPTDLQANELSLKRAKAVSDWLVKKGIPNNRIQYKGYGKTQPIASNETLQGREQNQRVEVKILNIGK